MDLGFVIVTGLLTSFHCVAMCGTMVATYAIKDSREAVGTKKGGFDAAPHLLYHSAKLLSYVTVGLVLGAIGGALNLGAVRGSASLLAGTFMILLGLNMANVHPALRVFSLRMPKSLQRLMFKDRGDQAGRLVTPVVFGLMTGLMPCGPLQAMELYAAGTGSALTGAAVMLVFGVMTIPTMLAFGAATQMLGHAFNKRIMTVGAVVVMVLGLIMLNRGLMLTGSPVTAKTIQTTVSTALGFKPGSTGAGAATRSGGVQEAAVVIENTRYVPDTVVLRAGVPVRLTIDRRESNACSDEIVIPSQGIRAALKPNGTTVVEFTPGRPGQIPFTCGMGMMSGTFVVTADGQAVATAGGAGGGGALSAGGGVGGALSRQTVAANQVLLFAIVALASVIGVRKWQMSRRAPASGTRASRASPPKSNEAAPSASPSVRGLAAWSREPVWVAVAILVAIVAGYFLGAAKARNISGGAIADGSPAQQAARPYDPTQFAPSGSGGVSVGRARLAKDGSRQAITLKVAGGYDPGVIRAKAGVPLRLDVVRHETNGCSKYLVFPALGIQAELPDDGTLALDVPGLREGRYRFQCQMNMLAGELVVE